MHDFSTLFFDAITLQHREGTLRLQQDHSVLAVSRWNRP